MTDTGFNGLSVKWPFASRRITRVRGKLKLHADYSGNFLIRRLNERTLLVEEELEVLPACCERAVVNECRSFTTGRIEKSSGEDERIKILLGISAIA